MRHDEDRLDNCPSDRIPNVIFKLPDSVERAQKLRIVIGP